MEKKPSINRKHRLSHWVERRWPLTAVVRWGSVEKIPGGAKFAYALGSVTLFLFAVLVITGVWQLLYYVPAIDHAYDSVMYLRLQVPLGWLVHGLHYWAAQAFIAVMGVHMARVFIWAAYKKPRELTWVLGVVLLLFGAAFIFTGAILPWDTTGYWAGEVGTDIAGTVPLIGKFLKLLMRGGDGMGQMTLSRAFVVHAAILPALTILLIAVHLVAFRQFGSAGPWNPKRLEKTGWFWPHQIFKDLLVVSLILMALICLSAFVRAPTSGPADPLDNSYAPKPEWNFLFLYEALKAFKGSWEWLGTVVIPALLVLLLFAVPFIDRNEKRNPLRRPIAMLCGILFVAVILVLTFVGHYSNSGAPSANAVAHAPKSPAPPSTAPAPTSQVAAPATSAPSPPNPEAAPAVSPIAAAPASAAPAPANQAATLASSTIRAAKPEASHPEITAPTTGSREGRDLFDSSGCATCHMIEGKGGKLAPDLSHEAKLGRSSQWVIKQITDPAKHNPSTVMPAHNNLTEAQLTDLADFILNPAADTVGASAIAPGSANGSQPARNMPDWRNDLFPGRRKNPVPDNASTVKAGQTVYQGSCVMCHGPTGKGDGSAAIALSKRPSDLSAPSMWAYSDGQLFAKVTQGQGAMPQFESLMTETQRWDVVNYIRALAPKPAGFQMKNPKVAVSPKTPASAPAAPAPTNQGARLASSAVSAAKPEASHPETTGHTAETQEGRNLFVSAGCVTCHMIEGKGGKVAPDLSHEAKLGRSSQWVIKQITDPTKHDPSTVMPAHKNLTERQLKDLAEYCLNPSSGQAAPSAGTESKAEKQPSAPSAKPAQEKKRTATDSSGSTLPAVGASGAPGPVVKMIGDPKHGAVLFGLDCAKCHGNAGAGNVPNPGSQAGVVASLAPISRRLFSDDPLVFAENIDRVIQHGASPPGPSPALTMPAFGDSKSLTQPEIANIEAYIQSLNGVDSAKIIHPGIAPLRFVEGTVTLLTLALLVIGGLWVHSRSSLPAKMASSPSPEEFQALKREVADLKLKLEVNETRNPKDSSGRIDS